MKQKPEEKAIIVKDTDLPLHCPTKTESNWNLHPKVYLDIGKNQPAKCPYCGTLYILKQQI